VLAQQTFVEQSQHRLLRLTTLKDQGYILADHRIMHISNTVMRNHIHCDTIGKERASIGQLKLDDMGARSGVSERSDLIFVIMRITRIEGFWRRQLSQRVADRADDQQCCTGRVVPL
jgi:hypothetical protein